jgi:putative nucleotidyltransferase with HDIG domain
MSLRIGFPGLQAKKKLTPYSFGKLSLGAAQFNWTRWLSCQIGSARNKGSFGLDKAIRRTNAVDKKGLIHNIAEELQESMLGISSKIAALSAGEASKLVGTEAEHFIELANLSSPNDPDFVDFIIDVLIRVERAHFRDNSVHSGVVTFYAAALASEMGFEAKGIQRVRTASVLHDIGKIGVSGDLLSKIGIDRSDKDLIDSHLLISVGLLKGIKWMKNVVEIVKHHHSHPAYDKSFCVDRMGAELYYLAHILRVTDAYDGLTSRRKYKGEAEYERIFDKRAIKVFSKEEALSLLRKGPFNGVVVDALESVIDNGVNYISNINKLFRREEIKFVWPGIEHLIRKNILSADAIPKDEPIKDGFLLSKSPLLWLASTKRSGIKDALDFIGFVKTEVHRLAHEKGLEAKMNVILETFCRRGWDDYLGAVYEALFRAINVGEATKKDLFTPVLTFLSRHAYNVQKLIVALDSLCIDPTKKEDAFYLWLGAKLFSESTEALPYYGEEAFISAVSRL